MVWRDAIYTCGVGHRDKRLPQKKRTDARMECGKSLPGGVLRSAPKKGIAISHNLLTGPIPSLAALAQTELLLRRRQPPNRKREQPGWNAATEITPSWNAHGGRCDILLRDGFELF
jgi:hypothetical protein